MIVDVQRLYEYGLEIKSANIGINQFKMVDGPDKVIEYLKDFGTDENHLLLMVLPSHTPDKKTESFDNLQFQNHTQFLILEKYDSREFNNNFEEMMVFHRTLETTKKLLDKIKADAYGSEEFCGLLSTVQAGSLQIDPIRHQSDCNGYALMFTF